MVIVFHSRDMSTLGTDAAQLSFVDLVRRNAERDPESIALLAPGRAPMRWSRLRKLAEKTVAALNRIGIGRGDRVALALPNGPETTAALLAISCGATCAPMNPAYTATELAGYLAAVSARAVVVQAGVDSPARAAARTLGLAVLELVPAFAEEAGCFTLLGREAIAPAPRGFAAATRRGFAAATDVALVMHTSGTTARPKVVPLTHSNLCFGAFHTQAFLRLTPADRCLNIMPLYHLHAIAGAILSSTFAGASIICAPAFIAPKFFDWVSELQPTWYTAVPTMHQAIIAQAPRHRDVIARSQLRFVRSTSAALPVPTLQALEDTFAVPVIEAYAMTEISQITTNPLPPLLRKAGSVGIPAGTEVAIIDDVGRFLPHGWIGEVVARGANLTSGYENDPEAQRLAFHEGWLKTGDLGMLDEDGYLFISGKVKEIISRAGEKISPREIEEVLLTHPAVAEAVVFAVPDATLGEDVGAAVVLVADAWVAEGELLDFIADRLASFKVPRHLKILSTLPTSATGKLQRIGLAAQLGIGSSAHTDAMERFLADVWADVLGIDHIGVTDNYFDKGADSILAMMVLAQIKEKTGSELPFRIFFEAPTIAELAKRVQSAAPRSVCDTAIPIVDRSRPSPVAPDQDRLIAQHLKTGNQPNRFFTWCEITGALDVDAFKCALAAMVARHELLRTRFIFATDGWTYQQAAPQLDVELPFVDLRQLSYAEQDAAVAGLVRKEMAHVFDLTRCPLWRMKLVRTSDEHHLLLVNINHSINDNWSKSVLFHELMVAYDAYSRGVAPALAPLPVQYLDFAAWYRASLTGAELDSKLSYWRRVTDAAPCRHFSRPERNSPDMSAGALLHWGLSSTVMKQLRAVCARGQFSFFMLIQAVFCALWGQRTGSGADLLMYSVMTSILKDRPELHTLFGPCSTSVPMHVRREGATTLRALVESVREANLKAGEHVVPYPCLVANQCAPKRPAQINFTYMNGPFSPISRAAGVVLEWKFESAFTEVPSLNLELQFRLRDADDGALQGCVFYRKDRFSRDEVSELVRRLKRLLVEIARAPEHSLSRTIGYLVEAA